MFCLCAGCEELQQFAKMKYNLDLQGVGVLKSIATSLQRARSLHSRISDGCKI